MPLLWRPNCKDPWELQATAKHRCTCVGTLHEDIQWHGTCLPICNMYSVRMHVHVCICICIGKCMHLCIDPQSPGDLQSMSPQKVALQRVFAIVRRQSIAIQGFYGRLVYGRFGFLWARDVHGTGFWTLFFSLPAAWLLLALCGFNIKPCHPVLNAQPGHLHPA